MSTITRNERRGKKRIEEDISATGIVEFAAEGQLFDERPDPVVLGLISNLGQDLFAEASHFFIARKTVSRIPILLHNIKRRKTADAMGRLSLRAELLGSAAQSE